MYIGVHQWLAYQGKWFFYWNVLPSLVLSGHYNSLDLMQIRKRIRSDGITMCINKWYVHEFSVSFRFVQQRWSVANKPISVFSPSYSIKSSGGYSVKPYFLG